MTLRRSVYAGLRHIQGVLPRGAGQPQACLLLQMLPELQVIGEESDGFEAMQQSEELNPDLVLLDIHLPKLNGIEAAKLIRELSPNSKLIFLSQNNIPDVVEAALSVGGLAFVYKAHAGSQLLLAIDAVLGGERFVSRNLNHSI